MMILRSAVCAGLLLLAAPASNAPLWLDEGELKAIFAGQSVRGHYPAGLTFFETYGADGSVRYEDERRANTGHWSITSGTFCTIYDDDPAGGCFRVSRESENCFEFYFVARDEETSRTEPGKPSWTARVWLTSKVPTCHDGATV